MQNKTSSPPTSAYIMAAKNIVSCSPKSSLGKSKRGRKRGRPTSKQSTSSSKKRKGLNPKYMGNWIIRPKLRSDGSREDVVGYFHSLS
ncbi:hypothetical protein QL285_061031 [Trifolium repens]|nr:hypothetical protein QL285_061031 [Trifolium repens]